MIRIIYLLFFVSSIYAQKKYPSDTWTPVKFGCKVGYVSPSGETMIAPQFEKAWRFSNGLAFVWSNVNHNDANKNMPLGEEYKYYDIVSNSITGIIDSTGTYIVQPKLNFQMVRPFQDGIAYVKIDDEIRIINKKGEVISFNDSKYDKEYKKILRVAQDKKTGKPSFANAYRQRVYEGFEACSEFSGNYAAVKFGGKTGYINRTGELVIVPQFYEGGQFINGYATVAISYRDKDNRDIKYYGIIDTLGNYILPPKYLWLGEVSEGLVVFNIREDGKLKSGYVDLMGNIIISPKYSMAEPFREGLASVCLDGKCGYINRKDEQKIDFVFDGANEFKLGVAAVRQKGKFGLINKQGVFVFGPIEIEKNCN